jgi:hypothetical protein
MEIYLKFVPKETGAAPVTGKSIKVVKAEGAPSATHCHYRFAKILL